MSREQPTTVPSAGDIGGDDRAGQWAATTRAVTPGGPLQERLEILEPILRAFGQALGGDPERLADLPFTEGIEDGHPASLFVPHDRTALELVTDWLADERHVGITSAAGSGKSALLAHVARELDDHDGYIAASVDLTTATERRLHERLLGACRAAGFEIDPDDYWEVADGIPWTTDGARRAVADVTAQAAADGHTVYLLVDGFEDADGLDGALREMAAAGVRLFVLGRPESRFDRNELAADLADGMEVLDGFEGFDDRDVAEYCARSLARFRGTTFDGSPSGLFSGDAISHVAETTDGNPRRVRLACLDLFTRAAYAWHHSAAAIDAVTITTGLLQQDFDFEDETDPDPPSFGN